MPEESATGPTSGPSETASDPTSTDTETTTAETPPTSTTTTTTSAGETTPSEGSVTETSGEEPVDPPPTEPLPCEGEAIPLEVAKIARVVIPDEPECAVQTTNCWEGPEEGTLEVHLAGQPHSCPEAEQALDCGQWEVKIWIPPAFQTPGLYHLTGPGLRGIESVMDPDQGDGTCQWNGGELSATLEVLSIDASGISARLCHIDSPLLAGIGVDLEGSFSVAACE